MPAVVMSPLKIVEVRGIIAMYVRVIYTSTKHAPALQASTSTFQCCILPGLQAPLEVLPLNSCISVSPICPQFSSACLVLYSSMHQESSLMGPLYLLPFFESTQRNISRWCVSPTTQDPAACYQSKGNGQVSLSPSNP